MSIRIKFSQSELKSRAANILDIPTKQIVSVCQTAGGKLYWVLQEIPEYPKCKQVVHYVTIWQIVSVEALQEKHVTGVVNFCPQYLLAALSVLELGLIPSLDELKAKYRALSKKHHPDVGGNAEAFVVLSEAYEKVYKYLTAVGIDG